MTDLQRVCHKMASRQATDHTAPAPVDLGKIWPASFFALDRCAFWQQSDTHLQTQMLQACAAATLSEALGIERAAMDYCASRVLAAETGLEKQIYSLIAAEEARHYHWLNSLLASPQRDAPDDDFAVFLHSLVAQGSPHSLSYLLQIILEGWGIHHYQRLASASQNAQVGTIMSAIAQDEALHYAAGIAHFDANLLSDADRNFIRDALATLCGMLSCGPLTILKIIESTARGFDPDTRRATFIALSDPAATQIKMDNLARYIAQSGMQTELDNLAAQGLLQTMPPEASLALYTPVG